jgi:putative aldouronate transport system permease protein
MRDYSRTAGSVLFDVGNVLLMLFLVLVTLYPFLFVVSRSVMTEGERAVRPYALIPRDGITLEGYTYILGSGSKILSGFKVTIFRTTVGTLLTVVGEAMFAWALSRRYYPLRGALTAMIALTLWFSAGMIPTYLVVRALGLYNTLWVYVVVPLMGAMGIIIMRTFFSQLPDSLEESAKLDGANDITVLLRIVFPVSKAVLATMALFSIVYHWNEWFMGIIYSSEADKQPVMVMLYQTLRQAARSIRDETWSQKAPPTLSIRMALIVVTAFPVVVAYPFFQRYFVKGMLIGSIKG